MAFVFKHGYKEFILTGAEVEQICLILSNTKIEDAKYIPNADNIRYVRPVTTQDLEVRWIDNAVVDTMELVYKMQILEKKP